MYNFTRGLILVGLLLLGQEVQAQFSISKVTPKEADTKAKEEAIRGQSSITNSFFSEAQWMAEKRRLRKERNTVELQFNLDAAQTAFVNWAAGGDNTFSGRGSFFFKHLYKVEKLSIEYQLDARYGISVIEEKPFKNEDIFLFNASVSWNIKRSWSYAASVNLRSQFSRGFKSRTDPTLVSDFMAPGTLDVSAGFIWKPATFPITVNLSPIGGSMTFVMNKELSDKGAFGVEPGNTIKSTLGSSVRIEYDKAFGEKKIFAYRTSLYSFTNYDSNTYVRWENRIEVRATRFFTTSLFGAAVYDKYAETPTSEKLQYNYSINIGLSYRFKNK